MNEQSSIKKNFISDAERSEAMDMLKTYADTALIYQDPIHQMYDLITDNGENNDVVSALWDLQAFIRSLNSFFLLESNVKAFVESGGGQKTLSEYLPALLQMFTDMVYSGPACALLELSHYQRNTLTVRRDHHQEITKTYGPKLEAYRLEQQLRSKAA